MQQDYSISMAVSRRPDEAFNAINNVRDWWERGAAGHFHEVGDEFVHWVPGVHYARIRVVELEPASKVVWQVVDNWMSFIRDQREWKGSRIRFDLRSVEDGGTEIRFTHEGLTPAWECYEACEGAWAGYVGDSLRSLIETGEGRPDSNPDEVSFQQAP